jgi:phosphopantothenoylcysteine decarboxylase/phosphopantothenate--cysteine ligase
MKLLVTAGPTREPIDPVRFISNRSSGKMGYAIAARAAERGHEVRLVSGPVAISAPGRVEVFYVETAAELLAEVRRHIEWSDALVMAAAVADWRPAVRLDQKMKKAEARASLLLEPTADVLMELRPLKGSRLFIGFAAETGNPLGEARRKLSEKNLDLIAANDVSESGSGFEVDTNRVTLLARDGTVIPLPLMSKGEVADRLLDWIEKARLAT